ncbi:MAG: glycosyltransferase family 2 protein [Firmicutes bacterium]|nr:glycosyltransferase family 2 protein [Bacillota bacterium]
MAKKRVLLGSPIRQKPEILKEFIESLNSLDQRDIELSFILVDDNEYEESSRQLLRFEENQRTFLFKAESIEKAGNTHEAYVCDDTTHYWKEHLIWRVAGFKDFMIEKAIELDYDYLFLIDSDLILHPATIQHLIDTGKDIISEVFWTAWYPGSPELPNVWLYDHYDMARRVRGERLSSEEQAARQQSFLEQLKTPGVYEVGGLGACTLISKKALLAGVSFKQIKNLTLWGEDRHFCVRAIALGLNLFVDTHYPAYHIYRESLLAGANDFKARCRVEKPVVQKLPDLTIKDRRKPHLTLSMIIKNEADRYLARVLDEHKHYIDEAVIIDDGSTDHSVNLCRSILRGIPLHIVSNSVSKFSNEVELRKQQWKATVETGPQWILNLDADEVFESKFRQGVRILIEDPDADVYYFRLYDFWDENHYREDNYWRAHTIYRPFLLRYRPGFVDEWNEMPLHCGRFPKNIAMLPLKLSEFRLKHLGWIDPGDRLAKYQRYTQLDQGSFYGWKEQYESILDPNPRLVEWKE